MHPPRPRNAALVIVLFWLIAAVIFGWIEHLVDSQVFPTTGLGIWWAIQTVTTVGYGDVVPKQSAGRFVAAILMLGGLSLLSVLTASVTSVFVSRAQEQLRDEAADPLLRKLNELTSDDGPIAALTAEISGLRSEIARQRPEPSSHRGEQP